MIDSVRERLIELQTIYLISSGVDWDTQLTPEMDKLTQKQKSDIIASILNDDDNAIVFIRNKLKEMMREAATITIDQYIVDGKFPSSFVEKIIQSLGNK